MAIPDHIICKLNSEYARSLQLHPHKEWAGFDYQDMMDAVHDELAEVESAYNRGDVHSNHGIIAESLQAAIVLIRKAMEWERRG